MDISTSLWMIGLIIISGTLEIISWNSEGSFRGRGIKRQKMLLLLFKKQTFSGISFLSFEEES